MLSAGLDRYWPLRDRAAAAPARRQGHVHDHRVQGVFTRYGDVNPVWRLTATAATVACAVSSSVSRFRIRNRQLLLYWSDQPASVAVTAPLPRFPPQRSPASALRGDSSPPQGSVRPPPARPVRARG